MINSSNVKFMQEPVEQTIRDHIVTEAAAIADTFYREMMQDPEAAPFLQSEVVDRRLRRSMTQWITDILLSVGESETAAFAQRQREIGVIHARINIPMKVLAHGIAVIKRECFERLQRTDLDRDMLARAFVQLDRSLDRAISLMNESYFSDILSNERNDQALRLHMVSHHLVIECERLRSNLYDWLRKTIILLYRDEQPESWRLLSLRQSELGLWISHKAELLFPSLAEIAQLRDQVDSIENALGLAISERSHGISEAFVKAIEKIDKEVTHAASLLASLADHALQLENARDPLTRVLNRRYMPSILQREVKLSIQTGVPFAILMADIDRFKQLNDRYGHLVGDGILAECAEILITCVRANDFVFRYGGEEFLIVMAHTTEQAAMGLAERLRLGIERHAFPVGDRAHISVTTSVGVALHQGHPDYGHVVERADRALQQAKQGGRNRCVFSRSSVGDVP